MTYIAQFYPEHLDVNGDAQNARVLHMRALWAGVDLPIRAVTSRPQPGTERPAAVVLGSSVDSRLPLLAEELATWADLLKQWHSDGVPILAVGTGYELLTEQLVLSSSQTVRGIGLIAGETQPAAERISDDLVVDSTLGTLVGYENHARIVTTRGLEPLGRVRYGVGDGDGREGVRHLNLVATHLHGPVLAKNPAVADEMLRHMNVVARGEHPLRHEADAAARNARASIMRSRGLREA